VRACVRSYYYNYIIIIVYLPGGGVVSQGIM